MTRPVAMSQGTAVGAGFGLLFNPYVTPSPSKADPLFAEAEENWYTICESPWGPGLLSAFVPQLVAANNPLGPRIRMGWTSNATIASFISRAPTFRPKYSGERPTIWPAMNTPMMRNRSVLIMPTPLPPKKALIHMPAKGDRHAMGFRLT